jgi:hypothetical protein
MKAGCNILDLGNWYCDTSATPSNRGSARILHIRFLKTRNKVINLIHHLLIQVIPQCACWVAQPDKVELHWVWRFIVVTTFIERWKRKRERERVLILTHILSSLKVATILLIKFAFISDRRNYPFYHVKWICINITIMTKVESENLDVCLECADKWICRNNSDMPLPHLVSFYIITQFFLKHPPTPTHHMMHYRPKFGY